MEKAQQNQDDEQTHHNRSIVKQVFITLTIIICLGLATGAAILFSNGYRIGFQQGQANLTKTGILHVTSNPTGAQVYIDGHLTSATEANINLTPGKYTVQVKQDGYTTWQKDIPIKAEVVSNAFASLYPTGPSLQSISTFGVDSALIDPTGTKLAFKISSQSAVKNGIYVLDMTNRSFPVLAGQSGSTQIVDDTLDNFSTAQLSWSPDGTQILADIQSSTQGEETDYLLNVNSFNGSPQDVTATLPSLLASWNVQRQDAELARLRSLRTPIRRFANQYFRILSWSPDESNILYQASQSGQMPIFIKPRRIGNNLLYEQRQLQQGAIYVYNITEDINMRITNAIPQVCDITVANCTTNPFSWFADSTHLLYVHDGKITIIEDDGSNAVTIYAGPFVDNYVYPWPDGSKIIILTNLGNPTVSPTLYTISLQ